jgi:hypothetical protein
MENDKLAHKQAYTLGLPPKKVGDPMRVNTTYLCNNQIRGLTERQYRVFTEHIPHYIPIPKMGSICYNARWSSDEYDPSSMEAFNPKWKINNPKHNPNSEIGSGRYKSVQRSSMYGNGDELRTHNIAPMLLHPGLVPHIGGALQDILDEFGLKMGSEHLSVCMMSAAETAFHYAKKHELFEKAQEAKLQSLSRDKKDNFDHYDVKAYFKDLHQQVIDIATNTGFRVMHKMATHVANRLKAIMGQAPYQDKNTRPKPKDSDARESSGGRDSSQGYRVGKGKGHHNSKGGKGKGKGQGPSWYSQGSSWNNSSHPSQYYGGQYGSRDW